MSGTKVIRCTCKHSFQDQEYGAQQRLGNINEKQDAATCTVCGNQVKFSLTPKKK